MKLVCCDALGTLIDISAVAAFMDENFSGQGSEITNMWRNKQIDYSRLRAMGGQYVPFSQITREALVATLVQLGIHHSQQDIDQSMAKYQTCMAFPDTYEFLNGIQSPWSILTNGDREFIRPILRNAGINCLDTHLFTSDQVNTFKVDPHMYELTWSWARELGSSMKSDVFFVSANQWDAIAAQWFGFTSCWVNRTNQSHDQLGVRPHIEVSSLVELIHHVDIRT
jgi:2-haloacid dehalogenase